MADSSLSSLSEVLSTLGMTREDLRERSDEMRLFLATHSSGTRAFDPSSSASLRPIHAPSKATASGSSTARSTSFRSSSMASNDASPPSTPIKSEPQEVASLSRPMDKMEAVIERQRLARIERRMKKDKTRNQDTEASDNPDTTGASLSGTEGQQIQIPSSADTTTPSDIASLPQPVTPRHKKYYRDHTAEQTVTVKRNTSPEPPTFSAHLSGSYYPIRGDSSLSKASTSLFSSMDQHASSSKLQPSPFSKPSSSQGVDSSPNTVVNLVSSPAAISSSPSRDFNTLPYRIPPGPYSPKKPEFSYAAILGQAILSSPDHRLTLQEIYDWITVVYPYFKRGETTWMNSIRHVLSTTVVFRKVMRDRSLGRTLWAIWDEDLECFKNGGFRKQFCKDAGIPPSKEKEGHTPKETKGKKSKKQPDAEEQEPAKKKKSRKERQSVASVDLSSDNVLPVAEPVIQSRNKPSSGYRVIVDAGNRTHGVSEAAATTSSISPEPELSSSDVGRRPLPPWSTASSILSLPELTPNRSSSSPPPGSSDMEVDPMGDRFNDLGGVLINVPRSDDEENGFKLHRPRIPTPKLSPVTFWNINKQSVNHDAVRTDDLESPVDGDSQNDSTMLGKRTRLSDKVQLSESEGDNSDVDRTGSYRPSKSKKRRQAPASPGLNLPPSPTPYRRSTRLVMKESCLTANTSASTSDSSQKPKTKPSKSKSSRLLSPQCIEGLPPSTPPPKNNSKSLLLSPVHTPLSHRGFHMSPTPSRAHSLAHYKSNLDPPKPISMAENCSDDLPKSESNKDPFSTPVRPNKPSSSCFSSSFMTPRKLQFPGAANDSPMFRTPSGLSPFRIAGISGSLENPVSQLDEENQRMAEVSRLKNSSPYPLFGVGSLYESPRYGAPVSPSNRWDWYS